MVEKVAIFCGLSITIFPILLCVINLSVPDKALAKIEVFMNQYIHARKLKKAESNGYDVTGKPIIDFEDFKKYYWINSESWKISSDMHFYGNFWFPIYCVIKYDGISQSWLRFGISYKDCLKMEKFCEELKKQDYKLSVRRIQKKNNETYYRLLESVQNDINKIRKENNKKMKKAMDNIDEVKLRLENESNM